jgi:hypothetical protein
MKQLYPFKSAHMHCCSISMQLCTHIGTCRIIQAVQAGWTRLHDNIQVQTIMHEQPATHKYTWKIVCKHFDSSAEHVHMSCSLLSVQYSLDGMRLMHIH